MSLVLNGARVDVPNLETISWLDDPQAVPRATDGSRRTTWIRGIVVHTVHGKLGRVLPGSKPSVRAEWYARYQARSARKTSWDYTVDTDGTVAVSNDPTERFTWHGHTVNPYTIGIELVQESNGDLYEATIDAAVRLIDALTERLSIQRQIPWSAGTPYLGRIPRCDSGQDGRRLVGVYGHVNVWPNASNGKPTAVRGAGDPGPWVFEALARRGYDRLAFGHEEDLDVWRERQRQLGFTGGDVDGIPGPGTVRRMRERFRRALWVE